MAHVLSRDTFPEEVLEAALPALVDFWAPWCGPCKMTGPIIDALSEELEGKVYVGKVNVDEENDLSGQYDVQSIPSLIFFKDGKEVSRVVGYLPKEDLRKKIHEVFGV